MAYKTDTKLILCSEDGSKDTLQLRKSKPKLTRFDFALDLGLGRSNGDYMPCYEAYTRPPDLQRTIRKVASNAPFIANEIILTYGKTHPDALVALYYHFGKIDGRVRLSAEGCISLIIDDVKYDDVLVLMQSLYPNAQEKLFYSIGHGLLRIIDKDGRIWDLVQKL